MTVTTSSHVRQIFDRALEAVRPDEAVRRQVALEGNTLVAGPHRLDLGSFDRLLVMGMGKAAVTMAVGFEEVLGDRIHSGMVVAPEGFGDPGLKRVEYRESSHPVPDARSVSAAEKFLEMADGATERDLVVVLLSGGGSALVEKPAGKLTLEHVQHATSILLFCGAGIHEMNAVRKHLSEIKGGRLMARIHPATCLTLALSDVVGSPLDVIASGPTVGDPSTYADAVKVVDRYQLTREMPPPVLWHLEDGAAGKYPDTPDPGDPRLAGALHHVVADNVLMARAAVEAARDLGYDTLLLTTWLDGEARETARVMASIARQVQASGEPVKRPGCLVASGEVPVTVRGRGKGGRCHELALSFARSIRGTPGITLLAAASDGSDGSTDSAGAIVDGGTMDRGLQRLLDPDVHLQDNDSYCFFRDLDELMKTGNTGTNTNDLVILLVE